MVKRKRHRVNKSRATGQTIGQPGSSKSETETPLSASERMAVFREEIRMEKSGLAEFVDSLPFTLDDFQHEALRCVASGENTLVCAPTAAGKTIVGEGAAFLALHAGRRAFYTTPLKALSNQKFREFQQTYGEERVGLLTGDTSLNSQADIVVMTTEVLRNMLYAGGNLDELDAVVLDEAHYLADRFRGPVWEEVLIQLPASVTVVALSATISNAQEFGRWIREVRGSCQVVASNNRPVPLYQHMIVGNSLYDLYTDRAGTSTDSHRTTASTHRTAKNAVVAGKLGYLNPDLQKAVEQLHRRGNSMHSRSRRHVARKIPAKFSRPRVLELLENADLLPAIEFVFSRAGCDDAVFQIVNAGITLTSEEEREQIREAVDAVLLSIPLADHQALNLHLWQIGLERGIAAHHAGMLPILKETVEQLFSRGLLKVVYATETLALGINMPARTVVLESLDKWNGSHLARLQPGDFAQLTGRAGRRGIDVEGHAVTLHRGVVQPDELAQLAASPPHPLASAFRPNYNMAVNLLSRSTRPAAVSTLESSFAQFQADESVVGLASKLRRARQEAEAVSHDLYCSQGDAQEYFQIRASLTRLEKDLKQARTRGQREHYLERLHKLERGQIISFRRGSKQQRAVVVAATKGLGIEGTSVRVVLDSAKAIHLDARDLITGLQVIGTTRVPAAGGRRNRDRQQLAAVVRRAAENQYQQSKSGKQKETQSFQSRKETALQRQIAELEAQMRAHPVHSCSDRELHAVVGVRWMRAVRQVQQIAERIEQRTSTLAGEFEKVCQILSELGYLQDDVPTERGQMLRKIFGERDLLVAQCLADGIWGQLNAAEFAAILSALVYEPRSEIHSNPVDTLPTDNLKQAWQGTLATFERLHAQEVKADLVRLEEPCGNLIRATYRWAQGATLTRVLHDTGLSGGDFVRWVRQVIDLLEQLRRLNNPPLAETAQNAQELVCRGIVEWIDK